MNHVSFTRNETNTTSIWFGLFNPFGSPLSTKHVKKLGQINNPRRLLCAENKEALFIPLISEN